MSDLLKVPTMAEMTAQGEVPEILFWVGCSGSFDDRAKKITKAIVKILNKCEVKFAVLGTEESCTGDPAKRAGNEFLFQMQAMQNISVLNGYEIKKIVTGCPHCFNTIKNEYPELGGNYEIVHHTQLIQSLIDDGRLKLRDGEKFKGKKITYHDPCYLGRANGIYEAPRELLRKLDAELVEMRTCRGNSTCCGAGGAQMWKEEEKGRMNVNEKRVGEAMEVKPNVIATSCPFCNTMLIDGVKRKNQDENMEVIDVAELIAEAADL